MEKLPTNATPRAPFADCESQWKVGMCRALRCSDGRYTERDEMVELILFKEFLSCKKCLYSWEGYAHGFSRGHSVLIGSDKILFVPDDIWYLFPKNTDFDIEKLFFEIGYRRLESCPKCQSTELFPPAYDQQTLVAVNCLEVQRKDFDLKKGEWELSPEALAKYAQV